MKDYVELFSYGGIAALIMFAANKFLRESSKPSDNEAEDILKMLKGDLLWLGPGITTNPNSEDQGALNLHKLLLQFEKEGLAVIHCTNANGTITWKAGPNA